MFRARGLLVFAILFVFITGGAAGVAQPVHAQEATAKSGSMNYGAVFTVASYGNMEETAVSVANADLTMLLSTNVQCIRIDIGYSPWLQNNQTAINEMTGLVRQIRDAGKCLIIADAASESYRKGGQLTWSQFMAAWGPRVSTLAALYHPDYYIVVKEPGWYVPLISDAITNPQFQNVSVWLSLTQDLTNDVHAASPSTVVGVSIAANSLSGANGKFYSQYLNQVQSTSGLSFIGFDIYGPNDQQATETYLSANPPSKAVWIPEAWSTATGAPLNGSPSDDAQWIQSIVTFATSVRAAFLIPFFTDDFASYSLISDPPTSVAQIVSLFQQRTPVFSAFASLVAATSNASSAQVSSTATSSGAQSSSAASSQSKASSTTSVSSSLTSHITSTSLSSGGKGIFSKRVIAVAIILVIIAAVAVIYLRRRR